MMRRVQFALLAALAGACVWFALPGFADSQARIVRLSYLEGDVRIDRHSGEGFEKAILNMPITQGTLLRTGANGRAEVEFENGTTVRLVPNAEVAFQQLSLRSSGAKVTDVVLSKGSAYFNVRHKGDDEFKVAFANRNVVVTHDADFRVDAGESEVKLAVFKGEVKLQGEAREVAVKKNETLTLDLNDSSRYLLAKGIDPSPYDEWSKNREQYQQEYASSSYASGYPYYGRQDLSYYGNYWYMPGYGNLWQPYNTGLGWDPFMNGAWAWYPGFGYTWVSSYPWGWLPYRYGNWVFIPGWGWGWMPGNSWRNWAAVPAVLNPPPTYVVPKPPSTPKHPTVVVSNPAPPPSKGSTVTGGHGWSSSTQPTPLPVQPHSAITPTSPSTGTSAKTGVVTSSPVTSSPTSGTHIQSPPPAVPPHAPAASSPRPDVKPRSVPEHSTPRATPPQSQPQSWSRPNAAPGHIYSGHASRGSSERSPH